MTSVPRAVLFDMDGLLVDTEPLWFRAETAIAHRLGVTWTREHQHAMLGSSLTRLASRMVDLSGAEGSSDRVQQELLDEMERLLTVEGAPLRPGAAGLLSRLGDAGIPCGLVSTSHRVLVDAVLRHIGSGRFAVTVAGDEVGHHKPHPEPYQRAARMLGLPPPDCIVLEDSPPGVASARAARCPVVAVPSLVPVPAAPGVLVLGSLDAVARHLLPAPPTDTCAQPGAHAGPSW